jgi:hypothetical protein
MRARSESARPGRVAAPAHPVSVRSGWDGVPVSVAGRRVESVREEWVVEDRWWTGVPLRRRYFELVLADGRNEVVFRDLMRGGWYAQRA